MWSDWVLWSPMGSDWVISHTAICQSTHFVNCAARFVSGYDCAMCHCVTGLQFAPWLYL